MDELHWRSAGELARQVREREVSSRELLEHFLDRVGRRDGPVNAVVTLDAERARAEADAADAATARGEAHGPLHGVPMTVKDSFSTAGMRTTSGAPELSDHVPTEDAAPVARLREAGAVIFGKTNLPIYAGDLQSYNDVFGTTHNPYDLERAPGGSSGGSAAALACGFTPIELGSDIGGSIRFPAHMSGVVGHKPSYAVVPAHGQIPGPPGTLTQADLAVAGPMARSVQDLVLGLDAMAGPDRWNQPAWRLELPPPRQDRLEAYRVATWLDDEFCPVDDEVRGLLEVAADKLAAAGATVADGTARPAFTLEKVATTFSRLLSAALAGGYDPGQLDHFAADASPGAVGDLRRATAMRHRDWLSANERRLQMRRRWEEFFESGWDVLLCPVMPRPAVPHDHSEPMAARRTFFGGQEREYMELLRWSGPAGACLLPATVVPVGLTSDGLPVGVQVIGPYLGDRTTLDLAGRLHEILGGVPHPAGF
ncbi:MAG: amidase [Acidimicrobiia bacterium]|nr:amidase [Acidimicrobiia bacterium]